MKHLIILARQVGVGRAIRVTIADKWRRLQEWRRWYQPGRRLLCSADYKRRHEVLRILLEHENNQYHEDMSYPRWKDGMNLHQITEALGMYDGEAGMQLSAL